MHKLLWFQMGQNPMLTAGCYGVCAALLRNPNAAICELDFSVSSL